MVRKKKFKFDFLEDALKPDLAFMVKEAEAEFSRLAQKIFEGVPIENEPKTNLSAFFKDKEIEKRKYEDDDDTFLNLLAEARNDAAAIAAQIFK